MGASTSAGFSAYLVGMQGFVSRGFGAFGGALGAMLLASAARAETLVVGPGKAFAKPCAAIAAAHDDDVIEIDAQGDYGGDVCAISKNGLTLRGVGGRAKIDAQGKSSGGKGTWVISGRDTTVENLEFSGATVPDQNGAGIRQEGDNLTVRSCYFHDNDDGILTNASPQSQILIERCEFSHNGFGDGYSHNMYIGNVLRFTLRYSYSHDSKIGHLVKSRAVENYILYNRLSGEKGTSSYELDLPNAGTSFVIGNVIEQGPQTDNPSMLAYGLEGTAPGNPGHALYVINNTFANDRDNGGTFVNVGAAIDTPVRLQNNLFAGPGTLTNQASAVSSSNFSGGDPLLFAREVYDYNLQPGSPCVDQGTDPGSVGAFSLTPEWQYLHPSSARGRVGVGAIDIGAYELGNGNEPGPGGAQGIPGTAGSNGAQGGAVNAQGGAVSAQGGATTLTAGTGGAQLASPSAETNSGCSCRAEPRGDAGSARLLLLVPGAALFRRRKWRRSRAV